MGVLFIYFFVFFFSLFLFASKIKHLRHFTQWGVPRCARIGNRIYEEVLFWQLHRIGESAMNTLVKLVGSVNNRPNYIEVHIYECNCCEYIMAVSVKWTWFASELDLNIFCDKNSIRKIVSITCNVSLINRLLRIILVYCVPFTSISPVWPIENKLILICPSNDVRIYRNATHILQFQTNKQNDHHFKLVCVYV